MVDMIISESEVKDTEHDHENEKKHDPFQIDRRFILGTAGELIYHFMVFVMNVIYFHPVHCRNMIYGTSRKYLERNMQQQKQ